MQGVQPRSSLQSMRKEVGEMELNLKRAQRLTFTLKQQVRAKELLTLAALPRLHMWCRCYGKAE